MTVAAPRTHPPELDALQELIEETANRHGAGGGSRAPHDNVPATDPEALIEEARRRARHRRRRNLVGILSACLGTLWLYSLLGGGGPTTGSASQSGSTAGGATPLRAALPEELSFSANNGIVLVQRDGAREDVAPAEIQQQPNGTWHVLRYGGVQWSPDGSRLLVMRYQSPKRPGISLVVSDAWGNIGPTITRDPVEGRWSPDGTRIAFVRHESGIGRVLYVATNDGRHVRRIATNLTTLGDPPFSWAPDGDQLVYAGSDGAGMFIVAAAGKGSPRAIRIASGSDPTPAIVGPVEWSPDASLIAFIARDGHVYVVRPDGTSLRKVADAYALSWSPDSRLLAVVGPAGPRTWAHVSIVRRDGTGLRRIAGCRCDLRGPGFSQSVSWSSDGTRIAFVSGRGNTVSTIRPDGSGGTVVATQAARGPSGNWYPGAPIWRRLRGP
jgi:hypothetical protein